MTSRLKRLRKELKKGRLDAILVNHLPDIRYLTGFSGSAGSLLVTKKEAWLLTDGRYASQVEEELGEEVTPIIDAAHLQRMRKEKLIRKGMTVGYQDQVKSVAAYRNMLSTFKKKVEFKPVGSILKILNAPKTESEVESIRKAANIAARVYREVLQFVKPGMRERELAAEISYLGRRYGSEGDAFDIIVASGHRSALPHGRASDKKIASGDMITLDFGCIVDGFNSDMTRTFALGEPGPEARKVYNVVYKSEREGVKQARAGLAARELDRICRDVIEEAGYGEAFSHSTGHGLGIEVHEYPPVSKSAPEDLLLTEGMVVTIEPGIYLAGEFGVRIEDDVLITAEGNRELTSATRKLVVV